jgi:hypothetical protein
VKTREQVTASGDFPAAPWLGDDIPARDRAWAEVRRACHEIAASRGLLWIGDEPSAKSVLYMKAADAAAGDAKLVECSRGEAEFVRLRLAVWAAPA